MHKAFTPNQVYAYNYIPFPIPMAYGYFNDEPFT